MNVRDLAVGIDFEVNLNEMNNLNSAVDVFSDNISDTGSALDDLTREFSQFGRNSPDHINKAENAVDTLSDAFDDTSSAVDDLDSSVDRWGNSVVGSVNEADSSFDDFMNTVGSLESSVDDAASVMGDMGDSAKKAGNVAGKSFDATETSVDDVTDAMKDAGKQTDQLGNDFEDTASRGENAFGNVAGTIAKLGAAAVAAGGAALGTVAAYSTKVGMELEQGMNEVFTLLPNASAEAMGAMTNDVRDFSKEFGVLPKDVIPALYQSLSAGVPEDNVFEFLEVAQKAAVGGVTDLETAVDGISSVVNAYGSDILSAQEASDIMFTTVKLGKTNFEELSSSLFNVIPNAAAAGVGFEEIGAAMATLTAQGTPTSVATTRIRATLDELTKSGSAVADRFEGIAGSSFREFTAAGGTMHEALTLLAEDAGPAVQSVFADLQNETSDLADIFESKAGMSFAAFQESGGDLIDALDMVSEHTGYTGESIADMFGSVEAAGAALALTGSGADTFASALEEMGDSAGATETAFDRMMDGIGPMLDQLRANLDVEAWELYEKFEPAIKSVLEFMINSLPNVQSVLETTFDAIGDAIGFVTDNIIPPLTSAIEWMTDNWDILVPALIGVATAIGVFMVPAMLSLIPTLFTVAAAGWAAVAPWLPIVTIVLGVGAAVMGLAYLWREHGDTITEKAIEIKDWVVGAFQELWDGAVGIWNGIVDAAISFGESVSEVFWNIVGWTIEAWTTATDFVYERFGFMFDTASSYLSMIQEIALLYWGYIQGTFENALDFIVGLVTLDFDRMRGAIDNQMSLAQDTIMGIWSSVSGFFGEILSTIWGTVTDKFSSIVSSVSEKMGEAKDTIMNIWGEAQAFFEDINLYDIGKDIVQGLINGIMGMASTLKTNITSFINDNVPGPVKKLLGIESPSRLFMSFGEDTIAGYEIGFNNEADNLSRTINLVSEDIADSFTPVVDLSRFEQLSFEPITGIVPQPSVTSYNSRYETFHEGQVQYYNDYDSVIYEGEDGTTPETSPIFNRSSGDMNNTFHTELKIEVRGGDTSEETLRNIEERLMGLFPQLADEYFKRARQVNPQVTER